MREVMVMTVGQAKAIRDAFAKKENPSDEEFFAFTEAMGYLIEKVKSPGDMVFLGGVYYDLKDFDLALKYYEMAAGYDSLDACAGLGYIWYYGRTGKRDYEKAFQYFSKAAAMGDLQSAYKIADMYKNGYYVKQDREHYKRIIKGLYPRVKNAVYLTDPLPEISMRLAEIDVEEGRTREAAELYCSARAFLAERLRYNPFFGDLNNMKWLIDGLYALVDFDEDNFDFYDLYHLLKSPCTVTFRYHGRDYAVRAVAEDSECSIAFGDKWYRTRDDFFGRATIENARLTSVCSQFYLFEVKR